MKNVFDLVWRCILSPLLNLVYPPSCMVCRTPDLERDEALTEAIRKYHLCPTCIGNIVEAADNQCPRCGASLVLPGQPPEPEKPKRITHNQPQPIKKCRHCFPENFKYEKIVTLGHYDGLLRYLVLRTKKDYSGAATRTLTYLFLREREHDIRKFAPDLIVPVPMYLGRFLRRGICAPIQMAEILSKELKIPWHLAIKRMRRTQLQWGLHPNQRKANVLGAFMLAPDMITTVEYKPDPKVESKADKKPARKTCRKKSGKKGKKKHKHKKKKRVEPKQPPVPTTIQVSKLQGKRILIVDDIMTTGVTCEELAKLLKEAGASAVMVAVLARATGEHSAK